MTDRIYFSLSGFLKNQTIAVKKQADGSINLNLGVSEIYIDLPRNAAHELAERILAVLSKEEQQ
jgi:hypothetical protein